MQSVVFFTTAMRNAIPEQLEKAGGTADFAGDVNYSTFRKHPQTLIPYYKVNRSKVWFQHSAISHSTPLFLMHEHKYNLFKNYACLRTKLEVPNFIECTQ